MGCGILTWHLKTTAQWWGPPNKMAINIRQSKNLKTNSFQPVYGSLLAHELKINHVAFTLKENKKSYNVFKGLKSTYDDAVDADNADVNVDDDDVDDDDDDEYEYDDDEDGYIYSDDDDDDDDDYFQYRRSEYRRSVLMASKDEEYGT